MSITQNDDSPTITADSLQGEHLLEVVWAKMKGFGWWPGITCENPEEPEKAEIQCVQFFDKPTTYAVLDNRQIRAFSEDGKPPPGKPPNVKGCPRDFIQCVLQALKCPKKGSLIYRFFRRK